MSARFSTGRLSRNTMGRMGCARTLPLLVGLCACSAASADPAGANREPRLDDFAEAIVLTPRESRAVHTTLLPVEVYRGVTRADLADLRVFNAEGQPVPHALRTLDAPVDLAASTVDLRFFPIESQPNSTTRLEALTLHVVRDESGTLIDVRSSGSERDRAQESDAPAATDPARIIAYVLDTGGLERPLTALRLELAPSETDFMIPVTLEQSDDLTRFSSLGSPQSLVRLTYAGERISQDRVVLPAVRARYVVLRWASEALPVPLLGVTAELEGERASAELVVHRFAGRRRADDAQWVDFDLGGLVPVDRVRVALSEDNALVAAELLAGPRADGSLTPLERTTVYRVATGEQILESPAIAIARRTDRFWAVRARSNGGGWGTALPELEIAYYPQQLIFLSRGGAPFTLAFGRHDALASGFAWEELVAFLPEAERMSLPRSDVDASPSRVVAGEAARFPPPPPLPLRRYALWTVLVLGVGGIAIAAWRLVRDVRTGSE